MTTPLRTLAVLTSGVLALTITACGNDDNAPEDDGTFETADTNVTVPAVTDATVNTGETINITCNPDQPCDVDLTITGITASHTCPDGVASYASGDEDGEDVTYIRVTGDIDAKSYTANSAFYITDDQWAVVDKDGYALTKTPAFACNSPEGTHWDSPLPVGQKAHVIQDYAVKGGTPSVWSLPSSHGAGPWQWTVPAAEDAASGAPEPTTGS